MVADPDIWQKLSDVSGLLSGILVALIGGTATYILTQRQRKVDEAKANRELAVQRVQTVQAFISNLGSEDEREKEAALLAINALGDSELASKLAAIYGGEGGTAALSRIAALSTGAEAAQAEESLAVLFDGLRSAVVRVGSPSTSQGSGFVVSRNRIVTAAHVVDPGTSGGTVFIKIRDRDETSGVVVALDQVRDLALIRVDTHDLPPLRLEDRPDREFGFEEVTAIGYGRGSEEVRVGRVRGRTDGANGPEIFTTEISTPGFSGAPAFNNTGRVVGVVHRQNYLSGGGMTLLIPAQIVKEFLLEFDSGDDSPIPESG